VDHRHFKIYKPYRYLSQFVNNQTKRKNKKLLSELGNFPEGIMAIGRLDEKSEGLLLLTTDGSVSEQIRGKHIEKEYYVHVNGTITDASIALLISGVDISLEGKPYHTLPSKVVRIAEPTHLGPPTRHRDDSHGPTSWISVTLTEGKYRQVRKMTAVVGHPTVRLIRVRIGDILLDDMEAGEVREVMLS
jgi:23S rRNA pseudouridine2457 synthase